MDLETLKGIIRIRQQELSDKIRQDASKLTPSSVLAEIRAGADAREIYFRNYGQGRQAPFKRGEPIPVLLYSCFYEVIISEASVQVYGNHQTIFDFKGEEVKSVYDFLADAIEREAKLDVAPF